MDALQTDFAQSENDVSADEFEPNSNTPDAATITSSILSSPRGPFPHSQQAALTTTDCI